MQQPAFGKKSQSPLENSHLLPLFPQIPNRDRAHPVCSARLHGALDVLHIQQAKLATKRKKVGEERVEVRLGTQMEDDREVDVVYVREDIEQKPVHQLYLPRKVWREVAWCGGGWVAAQKENTYREERVRCTKHVWNQGAFTYPTL